MKKRHRPRNPAPISAAPVLGPAATPAAAPGAVVRRKVSEVERITKEICERLDASERARAAERKVRHG